jgi:hypothetical protein
MNDDQRTPGSRGQQESEDQSWNASEDTRGSSESSTLDGSATLRVAIEPFLDFLVNEVARRLGEKPEDRSQEADGASGAKQFTTRVVSPPALAGAGAEDERPGVLPLGLSPTAGEREGERRVHPSPALWERSGGEGSPDPKAAVEPESADEPSLPAAPPSNAASLMARLAVGILLVVALINVPYNTQGTALARSIPSSASLVIHNGLLVKESNSPQIWVYRDSTFHWITSLDAFNHYGYRWRDVQIVEPGFLNQYDKGSPLYVLLKCDASPHIYRLEDGRKRWIVDLPTFEASGYVWQDVSIVPCYKLHDLPDGDSIPPGRGLPPPLS